MKYRVEDNYHEKYNMALWTDTQFDARSVAGFIKSQCNGLRLSGALGVKHVDYKAIGKLVNLQGLELYFMNNKFDVEILNCMPIISLLGLGVQPDKKISPAMINALEILMCTWSRKFPFLNEVPCLEYINTDKAPSFGTMSQGICPRLKRISLAGGNIPSFAGLEMFPSLEVLDIYACRKLSDISSLVNSESLLDIRIDGCRKINDFSNVIIKNIQRVHIENCGTVSMKLISETPSSLTDISIIGCDIDECVLEFIKSHRDQFTKLILPPRYMNKIM